METTLKPPLAAILILAVLVLFSCDPKQLIRVDHSESWTEQNREKENNNNRIDNETIVRFCNTTTNSEKHEALARLQGNLIVVDSCDCGSLYLFRHSSEFMSQYLQPEARLASSDGEVREEGDAFFNLEISMDTLAGGFNKEAVNKNTSTDFSEHRIIAVIDGGISDFDGLNNLLWVNKAEALGDNNVDEDGNCYNADINGVDFTDSSNGEYDWHGTIVSDILRNSVGVNTKIALMDLRIFDKDGNGNLFDAICAISYAIEKKADYLNLSWGYYRNFAHQHAMRSDALLLEYIEKAGEAKIPIFASAGNLNITTDGSPKYHYPSGFFSSDFDFPDNLISITALDNSINNLYDPDFGNKGKGSVFISTSGRYNFNGNLVEGTSYATPVALAYALSLTNIDEGNLPVAIKECIKSNSIHKGFDIKTEGEIDANNTACP